MLHYLIIGGVAGGASTAARLRRNDEKASIIMFEKSEHISYANCGLPYYIGGVIAERDRLFVQTPESFFARTNIEVRNFSEVTSINRENKTITVLDIKNNRTYEEKYDKLVLSPGAEPIRPSLPGINEEGIFTLRNVENTDAIKSFINKRHPRRAVIVGAGFIGLEIAENLHHLGIQVTIVEMAEQVMTVVDYDMASSIHQHLKTKNVEFYLQEAVTSFTRKQDLLYVNLKSGREIVTDMVILSIGVKPESVLAKNAGLTLGEREGIVVNEYLQTNDPDIYAVGDAVLFPHPLTQKPTLAYLAGPANKQGRIAADNITTGNTKKYHGTIGTAIAKVFDLTVASTGLSERILQAQQVPYESYVIHASSHAGYYPDTTPLTLKIMFHPETGILYGAQMLGYEGIDKRIDVLSVYIHNKQTVMELCEFEQAYAPPYSSAKDPVNIAGFVATNIINKTMIPIHWQSLVQKKHEEYFLLDVRTPDEFSLGAIEGAINIEIDKLRSNLNSIPKDKPIIVYCGVGQRGYLAARILMQNGFSKVYNLSGGYKTFELVTQKQSNEDIFSKDYIGKDDHIYQKTATTQNVSIQIDACGLQCPGPILRLKKELDLLNPDDILLITATDPGFPKDVKAWCNMTGNELLHSESTKGKFLASIKKGNKQSQPTVVDNRENKTIVVFSDDMDRALASFVIANGAASTSTLR